MSEIYFSELSRTFTACSTGIYGKCFIPYPKRQKYVNLGGRGGGMIQKSVVGAEKEWSVGLAEQGTFFLISLFLMSV